MQHKKNMGKKFIRLSFCRVLYVESIHAPDLRIRFLIGKPQTNQFQMENFQSTLRARNHLHHLTARSITVLSFPGS
jgi:hypothetical protein